VDKAKLEVSVKIKIWTAHDGHVLAILDGSEHISKIPEQCQVYAALLNGEEYDLLHTETPNPDKRLVRVFHFQKDPSRTHGIPCLFVIHRGEPFSQTKIRLQKVFGFYDKVFEKIKFAIVRRESYASPTYVEDADELFSEMGPSDELGLDHVDKTSRRGYGQQTAIFIKN
jgi:ubiquitin carboxyl-terminal hydrolase 7